MIEMLQYTEMLVTPEVAESWLRKNTRNRKLVTRHVESYANALRAGEWKLNGDCIRFGTDGALLDGQHRLEACKVARVPFFTGVMFGVESSAFDTMDTGRTRRGSDILSIDGEQNAVRLASICGTIIKYERGVFVDRKAKISNVAIRDTLFSHPGLRDAATMVISLPTRLRYSSLGAIYYIGTLFDEKSCNAFMDKIRSGENLVTGDPALLLRNRLLGTNGFGFGGNKVTVGLMVLGIKALNAHLEGKTLGVLRWKPSEDLPSVLGSPMGQPLIAKH